MSAAMIGRWLVFGFILLLLVTGAAVFSSPWLRPDTGQTPPSCPYLETHQFSALPPEVVGAIGAYEAIRETLKRNSIEGLPAQAEAIAAAFSSSDPKIASCAKRLAAEPDVESARRAFMRLNRLMEKHARTLPQQ